MVTESGQWIPPLLSQQEGMRSLEKEKGCSATYTAGKSGWVDLERSSIDKQKGGFEDTLKAFTLERNQIKEAMDFSLDNIDASGFDETCALLWDIDTSVKMGKFPYSNTSSESDPNNKDDIVLIDSVRVILWIIRRNLILGMETLLESMDAKQGYEETLLHAQSAHMLHSGIKPSSNFDHTMYEDVIVKDIILCLKAASEEQWEQIECAIDDGTGINFRYAHGWTFFHWTADS